MSKHLSALSLPVMLLFAGLATPVTSAQDFNVDFSAEAALVPSATFAAAGKPGIWNGIKPVFGGPALPLVDRNGAVTGVTVSFPFVGSGLSTLTDVTLPPEEHKLLRDGYAATDIPGRIRFTGLQPGDYDLLMYGFIPSQPTLKTAFIQPSGAGTCGGPWSGGFELGVTHVHVRTNVTGLLNTDWTSAIFGAFGFYSGVQIERVWKDLGGSTTGVSGQPELAMSGLLTPGSEVALSLIHGAPSSLAVVFINVNSMPAAFLGGVLHAFPVTAQVLTFTSAGGELAGSVSFGGAPSGTAFTFQVGIADPSVPGYGASLSNGVVGTAF